MSGFLASSAPRAAAKNSNSVFLYGLDIGENRNGIARPLPENSEFRYRLQEQLF